MLEPELVERAVDLQRRSYKLLVWMTDAVERGFISFTTAHHYATLPAAAAAWIKDHYLDLPRNTRPPEADRVAFANLFSTYLEGSFDLIEDPGQRKYSPDAHCFCPLCSWMVDMPRLQPKTIGRSHKERARALEAIAIRQVARDLELAISDQQVDVLADDRSLRETRALVAYGHDLLRRLNGISEGPVSLALWRSFAWNPEGSPKPGFDLTAAGILEAQAELGTAVRATPVAGAGRDGG